MKKLVLKTKNDEICLTRYTNDKYFKMKNIDKFNEDLNELKLFDQIVDIISKDEKYLGQAKFSYIWDMDNLLREKDSPFDRGKEVFEKLYRNRIKVR